MFVYRSLSAVTALAIAFFLIMLLLGTGSPAPAPAPDADAALLDRVIYHMNSDIDLSCPRWFFWILIGWVTSVFCMVGQDLLARARAGRAPWLASNTYTQDLIHGILWTWQWALRCRSGPMAYRRPDGVLPVLRPRKHLYQRHPVAARRPDGAARGHRHVRGEGAVCGLPV